MDRAGNEGGRAVALLIAAITLAGCSIGDSNSREEGNVAPKPNLNIGAQLPENIREQMAHAKPGADAEQMNRMKRHG